MKNMWRNHKLLLICILSGLLLAMSWPARGIPFFIFFALVPLFYMEEHLYQHRAYSRSFSVFAYAWVAFFVFNLLTTWWIVFATVPGMIVAVLLNSVFMAVPWWLMHLSRKVLPGRQGQGSIILLWLAFEYLHGIWDLSWSWLDLGNVFATLPVLVQWYEYSGTAGGATWILIVNMLVFSLVKGFMSPDHSRRTLSVRVALTTLAIAIPALVSFYLWTFYEEQSDPVEVVIIQPSVDPYDFARSEAEAENRIRAMVSLAQEKIRSDTRFVVAPEGANPRGIWTHQAEQHMITLAIREQLIRHPDISWVFGSMVYELYEDPDMASPTARPYHGRDLLYDTYNSAIMLEYGQPIRFYHKSKLVPGIEQMPFHTILKPVGKLVERFGGTAGSLGKQEERGVFANAEGNVVAPAVCYESIYGDYMTDYFKKGAGLIFIITNDGWWRNTPGHRQHHEYARLRAIESRRSIARAASTGISSFIDQKGNVQKKTLWWETTAISATINQNHELTFFSRHGNYLGKFAVFLSALLLLYMTSQSIIGRSKPGITGT
jgi:apolipoprotein N-acyltransferase